MSRVWFFVQLRPVLNKGSCLLIRNACPVSLIAPSHMDVSISQRVQYGGHVPADQHLLCIHNHGVCGGRRPAQPAQEERGAPQLEPPHAHHAGRCSRAGVHAQQGKWRTIPMLACAGTLWRQSTTGRLRSLGRLQALIHRDVKCPNLLLDRNWRCKITDFGMVREMSQVRRGRPSAQPSVSTRPGGLI